jgi:hypothetical protein
VTRAAETFTIPAANLPWPTETYGPELVTNGTFDSDLSGWTDDNSFWTFSSSRAYHAPDSNFNTFRQTLSVVTGKAYLVMFDYEVLQGELRAQSRDVTNSPLGDFTETFTGTGTASFLFIASASFDNISFSRHNFGQTSEFYIDNISVRELTRYPVSIQMNGRLTYADTNQGSEARPVRWLEDNNNYIIYDINTASTFTGAINFRQAVSGVADNVLSGLEYTPGILVPFNIASRHGMTFINGAVDGVALTEDTTPTNLPDLSAADLNLAYSYMGTVERFRVWGLDLGDTGLETATAPSLEPSLSLTFDSSESSYIVDDWSA